MAELLADHYVRHFGALDLVSQPHPGSRHREPKRLVAVGLRSARLRQAVQEIICGLDSWVKALVDDPFGFRNKFLCFTFLQIGGAVGQGTF